jgi:hypothetical protein
MPANASTPPVKATHDRKRCSEPLSLAAPSQRQKGRRPPQNEAVERLTPLHDSWRRLV